ncbi:polyketide synthase, enoylreductase [Trichoderma arundinaceum]|uniref:Polyketide synthase, enoylreductase n=1 Tax=Trichoderma arundinaceum TaxID=490622 RepID=A0A395NIK1_TRIAR|nr:polyketide synthase, enoylreductase [Trichoderma arundinaceum]
MHDIKGIPTKAYVVESKDAPFILQDVVLDEIQSHEILVEILYTGLCHTDIVVQQGGMPVGGYPAVLGHEGVGVVRKMGAGVSNRSLAPGDVVILSFHTCQKCRFCQEGKLGGCVHMTKVNFTKTGRVGPEMNSPVSLPDGRSVYAQFFGQSSLSKLVIVPEQSVIKTDLQIGDHLSCLAALSCGYMTGAGTVLNAMQPGPSDTVAVIGMGAVGFSALMAARALGVQQILAIDVVDEKLHMATNFGASHIINSKLFSDINEGVRSVLPDGVDMIIDATGVAAILEASVKALAHGGTLALVGVPPPEAYIKINALEMLISCKKIVGVIEGFSDPHEMIPRLVELYKQGKFPVDELSKVYPAEHLDQALDDLKAGKVGFGVTFEECVLVSCY